MAEDNLINLSAKKPVDSAINHVRTSIRELLSFKTTDVPELVKIFGSNNVPSAITDDQADKLTKYYLKSRFKMDDKTSRVISSSIKDNSPSIFKEVGTGMAENLTQKLQDKTLTIGEAFELGRPDVKLYNNNGKKSALLEKLEKGGFNLDDSWDTIGDRNKHDAFNKIANIPDYVTLQKVESGLIRKAAEEEIDYGYKNKFEAGKGSIRIAKDPNDPTKLRFSNATQKRGDAAAKKIKLPSVAEINKAIHLATLKLKDNKEAASFLQLKSLLGIRNVDVVNLTVGEATPDSKYGTLDPGSNTLYNISNKGDRGTYLLPSLAQDILTDLGTDAKLRMGDKKSIPLFTQSQDKLRKAVNKAVNESFEELELNITDQKSGKIIPFTISDLRKNVFDSIDEEYGSGVANRVLGHSTKGDVGLTSYKVDRTKRNKINVVQQAAEEFSNMYLQDVGMENPKELYKTYGFNDNFFKETTSVPIINSADQVTQASNKTMLQTERTTTDVGLGVDKLTTNVEKKLSNLDNLVTKLSTVSAQVDDLLGSTESNKPIKETKKKIPPKGSAIAFSEGVSSKLSKFYESIKGPATKAIVGALGAETVRQLVTNPAEAAQDIGTELLLERGLGLTPGAAVGFAMQSSPAGDTPDRTGYRDPEMERQMLEASKPSAAENIIAGDTNLADAESIDIPEQNESTASPMNYAMDQQMSEMLRKKIPEQQGIM